MIGQMTTPSVAKALPNDPGDKPSRMSQEVLIYIAHTDGAIPIRQLARSLGCHASTVLRRIRKIEARRDDPLLDQMLDNAGEVFPKLIEDGFRLKEFANMLAKAAKSQTQVTPEIEREARRILRRLCESGAFLAVAPSMEKAVVMREVVPGRQKRIAVVDRDVAHKFALNEWIKCDRSGKIACYSITATGRTALKRLLAEDRIERNTAKGVDEGITSFSAQHKVFSERPEDDVDGSGKQKLRYNLAESPLSVLARKKSTKGSAYIGPELIEAGERLREDFERAQMGPRVAQNWERFLTTRDSGVFSGGQGDGASGARGRVMEALEALGPGLADIVFRVCCFLEGLETAEKRMGWSARSGKVVLRIALQRLAIHYGYLSEPAAAPEQKAC